MTTTAYIAPSIETLDKLNLWPNVKRALPIIHTIKPADGERPAWTVNGHLVTWDGAGFTCDCVDWEMHGQKHGGFCKHSLAVALRSESYRDRIVTAIDEGGK